MAIIDIVTGNSISTGNDSIVIVKMLETKPGGASLDATGFTADVIPAGHPIIRETATGSFKPAPVAAPAAGSQISALPAGHTYFGTLIATIETKKPFAGIMVRGTVNPAAMIYPASGAVQTALYAATPLIRYAQD